MSTKQQITWGRFSRAVLAYLVPTFPLGYVWHLVLFKDQYHSLQLYRDEVIIPFGLASMFVQAIVFAWVYPRLFDCSRERWFASARKFFAVFVVLAWSFTTLPVAAKYQMTSVGRFMALESSFTVVHFLLISPLIAWVHREGKAKP